MKEKEIVFLCLGAAVIAWLVLRSSGSKATPAIATAAPSIITIPNAAGTPDYLTYNMPSFSTDAGLPILPLVAPIAATTPAAAPAPAAPAACGCGSCACSSPGQRLVASLDDVLTPGSQAADAVTSGRYLANMLSAFPQSVLVQ